VEFFKVRDRIGNHKIKMKFNRLISILVTAITCLSL